MAKAILLVIILFLEEDMVEPQIEPKIEGKEKIVRLIPR